MPLTVSRILNFLRRSSLRLARSMPSVRFTTGGGVGGSASGLVSAACFSLSSRRPSLTVLRLFLALADDDHRDFLADRRVGNDARQVAHLADVLAVEADDDVAGHDAGGPRRAALVDAGDQRAARRLDAKALGDLVGHRLDAHAEPAAPGFAELLAADRSP